MGKLGYIVDSFSELKDNVLDSVEDRLGEVDWGHPVAELAGMCGTMLVTGFASALLPEYSSETAQRFMAMGGTVAGGPVYIGARVLVDEIINRFSRKVENCDEKNCDEICR